MRASSARTFSRDQRTLFAPSAAPTIARIFSLVAVLVYRVPFPNGVIWLNFIMLSEKNTFCDELHFVFRTEATLSPIGIDAERRKNYEF